MKRNCTGNLITRDKKANCCGMNCFPKICRLCMSSSDSLIDINRSTNQRDINTVFITKDLFEDLLQFKVTNINGIPWWLCKYCFNTLSDFRLFKLRCEICRFIFERRFLDWQLSDAHQRNTKEKGEEEEDGPGFCLPPPTGGASEKGGSADTSQLPSCVAEPPVESTGEVQRKVPLRLTDAGEEVIESVSCDEGTSRPPDRLNLEKAVKDLLHDVVGQISQNIGGVKVDSSEFRLANSDLRGELTDVVVSSELFKCSGSLGHGSVEDELASNTPDCEAGEGCAEEGNDKASSTKQSGITDSPEKIIIRTLSGIILKDLLSAPAATVKGASLQTLPHIKRDGVGSQDKGPGVSVNKKRPKAVLKGQKRKVGTTSASKVVGTEEFAVNKGEEGVTFNSTAPTSSDPPVRDCNSVTRREKILLSSCWESNNAIKSATRPLRSRVSDKKGVAKGENVRWKRGDNHWKKWKRLWEKSNPRAPRQPKKRATRKSPVPVKEKSKQNEDLPGSTCQEEDANFVDVIQHDECVRGSHKGLNCERPEKDSLHKVVGPVDRNIPMVGPQSSEFQLANGDLGGRLIDMGNFSESLQSYEGLVDCIKQSEVVSKRMKLEVGETCPAFQENQDQSESLGDCSSSYLPGCSDIGENLNERRDCSVSSRSNEALITFCGEPELPCKRIKREVDDMSMVPAVEERNDQSSPIRQNFGECSDSYLPASSDIGGKYTERGNCSESLRSDEDLVHCTKENEVVCRRIRREVGEICMVPTVKERNNQSSPTRLLPNRSPTTISQAQQNFGECSSSYLPGGPDIGGNLNEAHDRSASLRSNEALVPSSVETDQVSKGIKSEVDDECMVSASKKDRDQASPAGHNFGECSDSSLPASSDIGGKNTERGNCSESLRSDEVLVHCTKENEVVCRRIRREVGEICMVPTVKERNNQSNIFGEFSGSYLSESSDISGKVIERGESSLILSSNEALVPFLVENGVVCKRINGEVNGVCVDAAGKERNDQSSPASQSFGVCSDSYIPSSSDIGGKYTEGGNCGEPLRSNEALVHCAKENEVLFKRIICEVGEICTVPTANDRNNQSNSLGDCSSSYLPVSSDFGGNLNERRDCSVSLMSNEALGLFSGETELPSKRIKREVDDMSMVPAVEERNDQSSPAGQNFGECIDSYLPSSSDIGVNLNEGHDRSASLRSNEALVPSSVETDQVSKGIKSEVDDECMVSASKKDRDQASSEEHNFGECSDSSLPASSDIGGKNTERGNCSESMTSNEVLVHCTKENEVVCRRIRCEVGEICTVPTVKERNNQSNIFGEFSGSYLPESSDIGGQVIERGVSSLILSSNEALVPFLVENGVVCKRINSEVNGVCMDTAGKERNGQSSPASQSFGVCSDSYIPASSDIGGKYTDGGNCGEPLRSNEALVHCAKENEVLFKRIICEVGEICTVPTANDRNNQSNSLGDCSSSYLPVSSDFGGNLNERRDCSVSLMSNEALGLFSGETELPSKRIKREVDDMSMVPAVEERNDQSSPTRQNFGECSDSYLPCSPDIGVNLNEGHDRSESLRSNDALVPSSLGTALASTRINSEVDDECMVSASKKDRDQASSEEHNFGECSDSYLPASSDIGGKNTERGNCSESLRSDEALVHCTKENEVVCRRIRREVGEICTVDSVKERNNQSNSFGELSSSYLPESSDIGGKVIERGESSLILSSNEALVPFLVENGVVCRRINGEVDGVCVDAAGKERNDQSSPASQSFGVCSDSYLPVTSDMGLKLSERDDRSESLQSSKASAKFLWETEPVSKRMRCGEVDVFLVPAVKTEKYQSNPGMQGLAESGYYTGKIICGDSSSENVECRLKVNSDGICNEWVRSLSGEEGLAGLRNRSVAVSDPSLPIQGPQSPELPSQRGAAPDGALVRSVASVDDGNAGVGSHDNGPGVAVSEKEPMAVLDRLSASDGPDVLSDCGREDWSSLHSLRIVTDEESNDEVTFHIGVSNFLSSVGDVEEAVAIPEVVDLCGEPSDLESEISNEAGAAAILPSGEQTRIGDPQGVTRQFFVDELAERERERWRIFRERGAKLKQRLWDYERDRRLKMKETGINTNETLDGDREIQQYAPAEIQTVITASTLVPKSRNVHQKAQVQTNCEKCTKSSLSEKENKKERLKEAAKRLLEKKKLWRLEGKRQQLLAKDSAKAAKEQAPVFEGDSGRQREADGTQCIARPSSGARAVKEGGNQRRPREVENVNAGASMAVASQGVRMRGPLPKCRQRYPVPRGGTARKPVDTGGRVRRSTTKNHGTFVQNGGASMEAVGLGQNATLTTSAKMAWERVVDVEEVVGRRVPLLPKPYCRIGPVGLNANPLDGAQMFWLNHGRQEGTQQGNPAEGEIGTFNQELGVPNSPSMAPTGRKKRRRRRRGKCRK